MVLNVFILNGENITNLVTSKSTFIQLRAGTNRIRYGAESGEEHMYCNITYRLRYLGV